MQGDLPESSAALVTPKQAAKILACSVQWLALLRMRGQGPAYVRHGRYVRYRLADLERWAEQHLVTAASPRAA